MTVRELTQQEIDIDVCDDVYEELYIAFCGKLELTDEGEKEFGDVMSYEVQINPCGFGGLPIAILKLDGLNDWEKRLRKAKHFFYSAAGYCACDEYDRWFKEDE